VSSKGRRQDPHPALSLEGRGAACCASESGVKNCTTDAPEGSTPRVRRLREAVLAVRGEWVDRGIFIGEAYAASEGEPPVMRRARAAASVLENQSIEIREGELIVGAYPLREPTEADRTRLAAANEALARYPSERGINGHMAIDNEKLLAVGIEGILEEIAQRREGLGGGARTPPPQSSPMKGEEAVEQAQRFYDACEVALRGILAFAERYAVEAERLAAEESDASRRAELEAIAANLRAVPRGPAQTFQQALQSAWLVHLAIRIECGMCVGRPDHFLRPTFERDVAEGRLTREAALELIECYLIKQNEFGTWPQGMMVGGQTREGEDACNDLSFLFLQGAHNLRLVNPATAIAWHRGTPDALLRKGVEMLVDGISHPAIFNDEVIVPGLVEAGLNPCDARQHIHSTCVEITPIGCSNVWVVAEYINVAKCLELALRDGVDPACGERRGPATGDSAAMDGFEQVVAAYEAQLRYAVEQAVARTRANMEHKREWYPFPLVSPFVHDCLERGLDLSWGGGRCNHAYLQAVGTVNVVDSLMALDHFVFERHEMTLPEAVALCDADFEGAEAWRLRLLNYAEKWGNDREAPDALGMRLVQTWYDAVTAHDNPLGGSFRPGFLAWIMHGVLGKETGALPDGRPAGEALADSMAAAQGRDLDGPTAVIRSATKIDYRPANGGMVLNLKFTPAAVRGEEAVDKLVALVKTYFEMGGFQVQINVVGREALEEAREHPERHRGLIVRVGGYSDYFTALDSTLQDEIIRRTEHAG